MLSRKHCCCGGTPNPACLFPCAGCADGLPMTFDLTDGNGTWHMVGDGAGLWQALAHGPALFRTLGGDAYNDRTYLITATCDVDGIHVIRQWSGTPVAEDCATTAIVDYDTAGECFGQQEDVITYPADCGDFTHSGTWPNPSSIPYFQEGDDYTVSASAIGEGSCCQSFTVTGCNSLPLPFATIRVLTAEGGTLLGTTATDSAGNAALAWFGTCDVWIEVEYSPEFTTSGASYSLTGGGHTDLAAGSVSSGYRCISTCAVPVPETLHATHPVFGAIVFVWNGTLSRWVATVVYSYPGYGPGGCAASTVTVSCRWNGSTSYQEIWKVDGSDCPTDSGGTTNTLSWGSGTLSCPERGFFKNFSTTPFSARAENLYGGTDTITVGLIP